MMKEALLEITRDLKQIYKRLDDMELTGLQTNTGIVPAPNNAGEMIIADITPAWSLLIHPAITDYHLHTSATGAAWQNDITMNDGATVGQAAGPLLTFDDTNNDLEITGCDVFVDPGGTLVNPDGALHVHDGSAGAVSANTSANIAVFESSGTGEGLDNGITILTPATGHGSIFFGRPGDNNAGQISYYHNSDQFRFVISGSLDFTMTANSFNVLSNSAIGMYDDTWIGLGAAAGRIEFDDQATDEINFLDCNVGIGVTAPSEKLCVGVDFGALAGTRISVGESGARSGFNWGEDADNRAFILWHYSGDYAYFGTRAAATTYNNTLVLRDGEIGIGTTSPGSLMEWNFADEDLEFADCHTASSVSSLEAVIEVQTTTGGTGYIPIYNSYS